MWPFGKQKQSQGFSLEQYQITPEEKADIVAAVHNFRTPDGRNIGMELHPPQVTRGLVAYGLWRYAEQRMESADFIYHTPNRIQVEKLIDEAIRAIKKAYSIHRLPIYLYDLARYQEKRGWDLPSRDTYRQFLDLQSHFRPTEFDPMFLHERDVESAIRDAQDILAGRKPKSAPEPPEPEVPRPNTGHLRHPRAW